MKYLCLFFFLITLKKTKKTIYNELQITQLPEDVWTQLFYLFRSKPEDGSSIVLK